MTDLQKRTAQAIVNVFETGSARGDYGTITCVAGDAGHLTYGRSQASLASGSLGKLLQAYCQDPAARFAAALTLYLDRLAAPDLSLDNDAGLRAALRDAAADPAMRAAQDSYFDSAYYAPAMTAAARCGLSTALGCAVVYDSFIQGGWRTVQRAVLAASGPVSASLPEADWVVRYVAARRAWLGRRPDPLPKTVYRMDAFSGLAGEGKWGLELPLTVHGVYIDEAALAGLPVARTLRLETPYMTGDDVRALQTALAAHGYACAADGVFGPGTAALVKQFQQASGLAADGAAGPSTRAALGIR